MYLTIDSVLQEKQTFRNLQILKILLLSTTPCHEGLCVITLLDIKVLWSSCIEYQVGRYHDSIVHGTSNTIIALST